MSCKICIFGDSVGKGIIFDPGKRRYVSGQSSFFDIFAERVGANADNFCRFGATLPKGAELIRRRLDSLAGYDRVFLEFGGNDSDFHWDEVAASPDAPHDCNTPLNRFFKTYSDVIDVLTAKGIIPTLINLAPVDSERYFRWISRENDSSSILRFLREPRRIEHWNEMYNNAVWEIAARKHLPVIDIRSPLLFERDFADYFCEDGIHPNASGQRLIADRLCNTDLFFKLHSQNAEL